MNAEPELAPRDLGGTSIRQYRSRRPRHGSPQDIDVHPDRGAESVALTGGRRSLHVGKHHGAILEIG
jgi:hypothetical protein